MNDLGTWADLQRGQHQRAGQVVVSFGDVVTQILYRRVMAI